MNNISSTLKIRILFGERGMLGPGKIDLLEGIARTGSIAAAGRAMGMSYKRAWLLVETMNAMFQDPLIESTRGGSHGGGAQLTSVGERVVTLYRKIEQETARAGAETLADLESLLIDMSDRK